MTCLKCGCQTEGYLCPNCSLQVLSLWPIAIHLPAAQPAAPAPALQLTPIANTQPIPEATPTVGSTIRFGKYDWLVLAVEEGRALLLSKDVTEMRRFHENGDEPATWRNSSVRKYLNHDFFDTFGTEKKRIICVNNPNPGNRWYHTPDRKPTEDRVFLLSLDELCQYLDGSGDYETKQRWGSTESAYIKDDDHGYCVHNNNDSRRVAKYNDEATYWWLRTAGREDAVLAVCVVSDGTIFVCGVNVSEEEYIEDDDVIQECDWAGLRPALWLKLD